ncbi:hypothetical protein D9611_004407 [Ephemerocybe angulata]|uniref:Uncharacterized protein n=1 Tax=Ephemerocybe angulata TaxID=980116 RepID=A0A8H5BK78_9AGAR|nr:hypothetical protein D9611_004407 [Tulosesus angulatus]
MATFARVMFVVLISVLHLVSLLLLTLSLALKSGGPVETVAIVVDWLALITMSVFLLHRAQYPQREYIRPRSLIAFSTLSFISAINLVLFVARLSWGGALVTEFRALGNGKAAAAAVIAIAAATTTLALIGVQLSYSGCYIEERRSGPSLKPFISRPIVDWEQPPQPHVGVTSIPNPTYQSQYPQSQYSDNSHINYSQNPPWAGPRTRKYVPGLFPAWGALRRLRSRMSGLGIVGAVRSSFSSRGSGERASPASTVETPLPRVPDRPAYYQGDGGRSWYVQKGGKEAREERPLPRIPDRMYQGDGGRSWYVRKGEHEVYH